MKNNEAILREAALAAFEATLNEQKYILGMPKLDGARTTFVTGYLAALASIEQAPDAEQGGTCVSINPSDLPKMPNMYFPSEQALWDHAVLTGWRVAHFAGQGVGMAGQVPVASDNQIKQHVKAALGCGVPYPTREDIVAWLESPEGKAAMSAEIKKCNDGLDLLRESRKVTLEMLNTPMTDFSKRNNQ